MDHLVNHSMVQRDRITKRLSIHRLVQAQYRYFLAEPNVAGYQEAFENTTQLLYERFPKADEHGQLFDHVDTCQIYAQHVERLKDHYNDAIHSTKAYKPSLMFCKLLASYRRYVIVLVNSPCIVPF
jgi:hypothetical protein